MYVRYVPVLAFHNFVGHSWIFYFHSLNTTTRNKVTWVDLPQPVIPEMTRTWCFSTRLLSKSVSSSIDKSKQNFIGTGPGIRLKMVST